MAECSGVRRFISTEKVGQVKKTAAEPPEGMQQFFCALAANAV